MKVYAGDTDVTTYFVMRLSATGTAATGLTATDFDLQYTRSGAAAAAKVDATLNGNGVDGAHSDSTVIEVDATSSPGLYRVDWVDAAFAVGVGEVILGVKCATAFADFLRIELGYQRFDNGIVWVDDAGTNSTTWPYGTAIYPTSTIANGKTIADANSLHNLYVEGIHTLAAAMEHYNFFGSGHVELGEWILCDGNSIEHSAFHSLVVSGATGNGANALDVTRYTDCALWAHTNINGVAIQGAMFGACSLRDTGYSMFVGTTFGGLAACTLTLQAPSACLIADMRGILTIAGMDGGTASISMANGSSLTLDNTNSGGTLTITGTGRLTDNSAAGCTVNDLRDAVQTGDNYTRIGAAGAGLTAINLPDQAMNITGDITGDLSGSVGSVTGAVGSVSGDTKQTADHTASVASILADTANIQPKIGTPAVSVSADIAAVKVDTAATLKDTGTDGVVVAAVSKTGYKLASDGLDQISAAESTGKPTTFAGWIMWLIQGFRRSKLTSSTLTVQKEDGTTVTTQAVSDDGTTQTLGPPS